MASPISVSSYSATDASEAPSDPPAALASSSESSRTEAADLPAFFFLPRRHARVLACAEGGERGLVADEVRGGPADGTEQGSGNPGE